jgi:hypothetical protein
MVPDMDPFDYAWKFLKGPNNPDIYDMETQTLIAEKDAMESRAMWTGAPNIPSHIQPLTGDEMIRYQEMQREVTKRTMAAQPQPASTQDEATGPAEDVV